MEYDMLVGASAKMLTAMVKIKIATGWKPIGGVSVAMDNYGNEIFAQAVIKGD